MCHGLAPKTFEYFAGGRRIYEIGLQLMSGGRAPHVSAVVATSSFLGAPAAGEPLMKERVDYVALSLLPINWWRDTAAELRAGNSPAVVLQQLTETRWPQQPHRRDEVLNDARSALAQAAAKGLTSIVWSEPGYPPPLAAIIDPPPAIWTRGSLAAFEPPAVAIVGSRAASPYALEVASRLAADVAARGFSVVSGLARGVDSAAHRGALSVGGVTIAVLGCAADVIYPAEHDSLAQEIQADGLVMSELVPGTPPLPHFFPQRNRLISGLSLAVVVVEAGEHSGSLITARCALEQGRDVLAVPGNVLNARNRGGHMLLRDGAKIVETADDIFEELGIGRAVQGGGEASLASSAAVLEPLLAHLPLGEAIDLDAISARSGLSTARLLPRLLELELQGLVRRAGAGRFVRFDRPC
jgi:DNA processing protein